VLAICQAQPSKSINQEVESKAMSDQDVRVRQFASDLVLQLRQAGYQALWAGGCVRDLLMGNPPHDYDIATSATPDEVRELFGKSRTLTVGAAFGVIIVLPPRSARDVPPVEVATFRTDSEYSDGRRPDAVTFSTPQEDAARRDFTINGMFFDPVEERVIDYVGGKRDLEAGVVRAIGDAQQRIAEDKLRMLRAVRFAARFEFMIEERTRAAIERHAPELQVVSGERIAVELRKSLETDRASWALDCMANLGLLPVILPEIAAEFLIHRNHALRLVAAVRSRDWRVRFAALLLAFDLPGERKQRIESIKSRLRLANDDCRALRFALESYSTLRQARQLRWSRVQPLMIHPDLGVAIDLLTALGRLGEVDHDTLAWLIDRVNWSPEELNPPPLVTGKELIEEGWRPGPEFREVLAKVRAQQLDGELISIQAAMQWIRRQQAPRS
jgi:poly(A) polymerase